MSSSSFKQGAKRVVEKVSPKKRKGTNTSSGEASQEQQEPPLPAQLPHHTSSRTVHYYRPPETWGHPRDPAPQPGVPPPQQEGGSHGQRKERKGSSPWEDEAFDPTTTNTRYARMLRQGTESRDEIGPAISTPPQTQRPQFAPQGYPPRTSSPVSYAESTEIPYRPAQPVGQLPSGGEAPNRRGTPVSQVRQYSGGGHQRAPSVASRGSVGTEFEEEHPRRSHETTRTASSDTYAVPKGGTSKSAGKAPVGRPVQQPASTSERPSSAISKADVEIIKAARLTMSRAKVLSEVCKAMFEDHCVPDNFLPENLTERLKATRALAKEIIAYVVAMSASQKFDREFAQTHGSLETVAKGEADKVSKMFDEWEASVESWQFVGVAK